MKKLIFNALLLAFFAIGASAQPATNNPSNPNCTCNPKGWQPFTAYIGNKAMPVNCGYQFSVNCREPIRLNGMYKCTGDCKSTYSAVLKNSSGVVVMSYPSFSFPWSYSFTAAGNYSLEIVPKCGNTPCEPCRFFFTVVCPTSSACDCGEWRSIIAVMADGTKKTVSCGYQFAVKLQQKLQLEAAYVCRGNCAVKYEGVLKNSATTAVIMNYPSMSFPWSYTFATAGTYELDIIPLCGDKRCPSCKFYITVR